MANLSTPGPQEIYVRFNIDFNEGDEDLYFVGTCVTAPEPEQTPQFLEVFADYGTSATPFNKIWAGSTWLIPLVVNRVNLDVCRMIRDQPTGSGKFPTLGTETNLDRGTLMVGIQDMQLIIANTYFPTVNSTPPSPTLMSPGRKYWAVTLEAYKESTVGTRVEEISMVFKAENWYTGPFLKSTGIQFYLFTEDPADPDFAVSGGKFINLIPD